MLFEIFNKTAININQQKLKDLVRPRELDQHNGLSKIQVYWPKTWVKSTGKQFYIKQSFS